MGQGVIVLPLTKTSARTGSQESVTITDPWVGRLLYLYCHNLDPMTCIGMESPGVHRRRFKQACVALRLSELYQWYSLRRGGATFAYQRGLDMGGIAIRGRWANARTARIYINDGLSLLAQLAPTSRQRARLEALASAY
eukprot:3899121-Amphidinium_carterae.1